MLYAFHFNDWQILFLLSPSEESVKHSVLYFEGVILAVQILQCMYIY